MDTHTVLDGDFAEVAERAGPAAELAKHIGERLRDKNVASVTAIHDALRHVDTVTGDVFFSGDVHNAVDGTGVHTNAHGKLRQIFQRKADLHGALHGRLRIAEEHQRHAIAGGQADELILRHGTLKFRRFAHHALQAVYDLLLGVGGEARIRHDVHEQDVGHFKRELGGMVGRFREVVVGSSGHGLKVAGAALFGGLLRGWYAEYRNAVNASGRAEICGTGGARRNT